MRSETITSEAGEQPASSTPVIDIHAHAFADELAPRAVPLLAEQSGLKAWHDGTVAGLLAEADRAGVDICVVQPVATKASQVCTINDWCAANSTDRLHFFGSMHPDFEDPRAELQRISAMGLKGVKLHTEYQQFTPDEPRMAPIYEALAEFGMCALFHAGEDEFLPTCYGASDSFARMLDRWPGFTPILAHMGGYKQQHNVLKYLAGRDCYFDTCYGLGHMPEEDFLAIVEAHGYERILFGSDSPWDDQKAALERVRTLPLPAEQRDAIAGGNAARLLGIPVEARAR